MPEQTMDKRKNLIGLLFVLALAGVTMFLLLRGGELERLLQLLPQIKVIYVIPAVATMAFFWGCEAANVRMLLRHFDYHPTLRRCFGYALIDFYFSSISPGSSAGQPAQICYMHRDGIEVGASSVSLLLFNMAYHAAVLLVAGTALLWSGWPGGELGALKYLLIYGAAAQSLLTAVYAIAVFSPRLAPLLANLVLTLLTNLHLLRRPDEVRLAVETQLAEYCTCAQFIRRNPAVLLRSLLLTTCHVLALYSIPFWICLSFGVTEYDFWHIIAMQSMLTLAMESLPIPGDVGVAEGCYLLMYSTVFGAELALPAMLLARGFNFYLGLLCGGVTAAALKRRRVLRAKKARLCST